MFQLNEISRFIRQLSYHHILLMGICVIVFISHVGYVVVSHQYPEWDEHHYMSLATEYDHILRDKGVLGYGDILAISAHRQPVYPLYLWFFRFVFGPTHFYKVALIANGFLYSITIISVYLLSRKYMGKTASLMASFLAASYGNALFYLHFTYSETALTTAVVVTLTLLAYSDGLLQRRVAIGAALLLGVSWLTKWSSLPFLIMPLMVVGIHFLYNWITTPKLRPRLFIHVLILVVVGIIMPIIVYYLPNITSFIEYVRNNQKFGPEWVSTYRSPELATTYSIRSIMYYWNIISQNTIFFFGLFGIGMLVSLRYIRRYYFVLSAFASQYAFLTFITIWKEDRFAVSMYPLLAIISATVFEHIRVRYIRQVLMTVTVGMGIMVFFAAVWDVGPLSGRGLADYITPRWVPHPRRVYITPLIWPPRAEYVNAHQLFELLTKDKKINPHVVQLFNFQPWSNAVHSLKEYEERGIFTYEIIEEGAYTQSNLEEMVHRADFLLTRGRMLHDVIPEFESTYRLVTAIPVPIENLPVYVYRKQ